MITDYIEQYGYGKYVEEVEKRMLPCPFCGSKPFYHSGIHIGYDEDTGYAECPECGVNQRVTLYSYSVRKPEDVDLSRWNNRWGGE